MCRGAEFILHSSVRNLVVPTKNHGPLLLIPLCCNFNAIIYVFKNLETLLYTDACHLCGEDNDICPPKEEQW